MRPPRVECNLCINFIPIEWKSQYDLLSKIKTNAQCKLGKRVLFRKPKHPNDDFGYFRYCNDYKKKDMEKLTDNYILTFGKYKDCKLIDIPGSYLLYLEENIQIETELKAYIEENRDVLEQEK